MKSNKHLALFTGAFLCSILFSNCADNPAEGVAEADVREVTDESASPAPPPSTQGESRNYRFTEDSSITFVGSKVTGSHEGGFKKFSGYFSVAGDALGGGEHKVVIDMTSTWADHPKLEGHLKAPDFFDVEQYPESVFILEQIDSGEGPTRTLSGRLTLHGVTKEITFPARITEGDDRFQLEAEFFVKRFDFGIIYPGKADDLIRDEVVIKLNLTAVPG